MEVRLLSVGARGFFLAASRLDFAASPLNSVAPNEKKTSGTQGNKNKSTQKKILPFVTQYHPALPNLAYTHGIHSWRNGTL